MQPHHATLAAGRWQTFSLAEQLGNVGSEVARAISWRERGNEEYFESAFARMLELLDLSIADDRWRGAKRKELVRVRESLCESFEEPRSQSLPLASWNAYFQHFAVMARRQKGL